MIECLRVVAAVILDNRKVLLVSKHAAPEVFYLPGGKPDVGEAPLATLARELGEELGVRLVGSELLGLVSDRAALEQVPMEMAVYFVTVAGLVAPRAEIAATAWVSADGRGPGTLASAVRNHVLPELIARGLVA